MICTLRKDKDLCGSNSGRVLETCSRDDKGDGFMMNSRPGHWFPMEDFLGGLWVSSVEVVTETTG